ncbi:MAG: sugar ABC transporter permease [Meiothermus sp.]|uniref:carbohydrate ABC transporter permease n=1 Tax=Meiothermus sp. TaxID=1955249 RepID=UPI0025F6F3BE|nr:sugar ABC transporter permease [Meiothermus sp.]MCS7058278.1 sugar ABC transporter permease [Meiothermus sp.]MCS7193574.1 sugar ABC transporter permease [Meiothermus sp.]MCX7739836.1 sugar ABC transporter permease [Meiothermus sp.]MDW8090587.1 sugar ABC transporter permease [Meiothermus sp.]MDW8480503.1 sugar ABC transporter permease [Meiothermus sp.]
MRWFRNKDTLYGFLVLLPSLVLLGVFVYGFILQTFLTSLTDWGRDPTQALSANPQINLIGFENYRELFTGFVDARFRQDLVNTFFFTLFFILGCIGLGLGLAIALDRAPRGEGFFRTVFLFPMSLSFIVTGTIWRWMLQPEGGVNQLPTLVGLPKGTFAWLTSRDQVWRFSWNDLPFFTGLTVGLVLLLVAIAAFRAGERKRGLMASVSAGVLFLWAFTLGRALKPLPYDELHGFNLAFIGIILAAVWQMSGYTMALYLAGLRGIPEELREAARVDGATEWQLYRHVILPMLAPITLSAVIILGHISLKIFDLVFAMAGADNAPTDVPALLMYLTTFRANQIAKGAAIGMVLLVMVALVIVPYLYRQLKGEVRR